MPIHVLGYSLSSVHEAFATVDFPTQLEKLDILPTDCLSDSPCRASRILNDVADFALFVKAQLNTPYLYPCLKGNLSGVRQLLNVKSS